jgi:hypothetical protein
MAKEFEELIVGDKVGVTLVVLPYGGVTEFIEEEVGLNVSEEPWYKCSRERREGKWQGIAACPNYGST